MLYKILDRYIFIDLVKTFLLTLCILSAMFFLVLSLQVVRKYSQFISVLDILAMAPYTIGKSISFTIPLAMLATTTLIYGRMAYEREILILRAAGIHFYHIIRPSFLLGFLLCCLCLYLNGNIAPYTMHKQREMLYRALEAIVSTTFPSEETTIDFIPNVCVYYRRLRQGQFQHLVLQHITQNAVTQEIIADTGSLEYEKDKKLLTFHLTHGSITHISRGSKQVSIDKDSQVKEEKLFFDAISIPISLPQEESTLSRNRSKYKYMSELSHDMKKLAKRLREIRSRLQDLRQNLSGNTQELEALQQEYRIILEEHRNHAMEWHERLANSLASLLVVLLGAPLGMLIRHENRLVAFGVGALPVLLIYYPLQMLGSVLLKKGIPPFIAAWLGTTVTSLLGLALLLWLYRK